MDSSLTRILCVDDEPNVLDGLSRQLRRLFAVSTATSGASGLELISKEKPFPVIVSDMRMPGMDGAAFLCRVREIAPDSVRLLLTGQTDMQSAIVAVNEGQIFRFLTKPCSTEILIKALESAVEQHLLITSERVLLEQTLHGSIKALLDILALANPLAFGRATRAKKLSGQIARILKVNDIWKIEVAAMLSQTGSITLPVPTAVKYYQGQPLAETEQAMVARMPEVAAQLISNIPRMEAVRDILRYQFRRFDGAGSPADGIVGDKLPLGARILKVVLDYDILDVNGENRDAALATFRTRSGWYDPAVMHALITASGSGNTLELRDINLSELRVKMVFAEDVVMASGMLLIARGQEVTESLIDRLRNISSNAKLKQPFKVVMPSI